MKVKARLSDEEIEIKSIEDALYILMHIGNSLDAAVLVRLPGKSSMLTYEGLADNEPSIFERPDTKQGFEAFLYSLFDPFLYKKDFSRRSMINLHQFSEEEHKRAEYALQITMLLYLKNEFADAAEKYMRMQADSAAKTEATTFYFD